MASTVVVSVNAKTRLLVLKKMGPATVPKQGGLVCSVIGPAQRGTMESNVLKTAHVRMGQLVIQLQV